MNFHKSHYQRYHQNDGGSWQSHTHSPADTELAAPRLTPLPCSPRWKAVPNGPEQGCVQSRSAATQEGSSKVRDKGTAGLILCLMWHKVPSAQRAPANERHCPKCKQARKGSVFKASVLHFNEDFFPPKKF